MSSHPHEVPFGWRKGQSLLIYGDGPVFALRVEATARCDDPYWLNPEHVAFITFTTNEERGLFLRWWHS